MPYIYQKKLYWVTRYYVTWNNNKDELPLKFTPAMNNPINQRQITFLVS